MYEAEQLHSKMQPKKTQHCQQQMSLLSEALDAAGQQSQPVACIHSFLGVSKRVNSTSAFASYLGLLR